MCKQAGIVLGERNARLAAWYLTLTYNVYEAYPFVLGLMTLILLLLARLTAEDPAVNRRQSRAALRTIQVTAVSDADNAALDYRAALETHVN